MDGPLLQYAHALSHAEGQSAANAYANFFDKMEQRPCLFGTPRNDLLLLASRNVSAKIGIHTELERRIIGLRYRIESVGGGASPQDRSVPDPTLLSLSLDWWQQQKIKSKKFLDSQDIESLSALLRYQEILPLLKRDADFRAKIFKYLFRYRIKPSLFICYPNTIDKLHHSHLLCRIAHYDGVPLAIKVQGMKRKDLTLLFEGKSISILNPKKRVSFAGGLSLTIEEIFQIFRNKDLRPGPLEFFEQGITAWNAKRFLLQEPLWWQHLPPERILTKEKLEKLYGMQIKEGQWLISVVVTRETPDLQLFGAHGFLRIAVHREDGNFALYPFGKFTEKNPEYFFEYVGAAVGVVPAVIAYPDENIYYKHREHKELFALASYTEGLAIMDSVRKDIERGQNGNLVFQFLSENCLIWAFKKANKHLGFSRIPPVFSTSFFKAPVGGPLGLLVRFLELLPSSLARFLLHLLLLPFGSYKSREVIGKHGEIRRVSLFFNAPWDGGREFLHPQIYFHD